MADEKTLGEMLAARGFSRRSFLKYASFLTSSLALGPHMAHAMAEGLAKAHRQSVIWLSFQECTGCIESITRSFTPTIENLIFNFISLDYQHTLQAASGEAAEEARMEAMRENKGKYIVVVDGSIPLGMGGAYSTIAGQTNLQILEETVENAMAVIAVGTCATFGGIPAAHPNPTQAVQVDKLVKDKPVINISGCPPIPDAMTGVIANILALGQLPDLDELGRPLAYFGDNIHDRCYRRPFYERGQFAKSFDDEGARKGWCLYELGCKGPVTYNACATLKWNGSTSFPIESGHGCLGCSEPNFWDKGGFYKPLPAPTRDLGKVAAGAAIGGAAVGVASAAISRARKKQAAAQAAPQKEEQQ